MSTTAVNVQVPSDVEAPIIADFFEHALRVAYVERTHLLSLPQSDWDEAGVYILLTTDGKGHAYVGQARRLRERLKQHNHYPKLDWQRAIVVKRDTTDGFNTAEIGYLEGRLSAELGALDTVTVIEGQKSGDETLSAHMRLPLDSFVKSILGALRLAGISILRATPDTETEGKNTGNPVTENKEKKLFSVKLSDLVSSGLLLAGKTLYLNQRGKIATGTVTVDGEIIVDGVTFRSPSAAAAKALEVQSSNGWVAWRVGGLTGPFLDAFRRQWLAQQTIGEAEEE